MTENILTQGPNVVSEDGFKQLFDEGYFAEIVCMQSAEKQHNSFSGNWIIRAVSPDGQVEKVLVTSRKDFKVREFRTINGLHGFFHQFNLKIQHVPWHEGVRCRIRLPKFEEAEREQE
ncbi:hypothetical protein ABLN87_21750 [Ruegeria sp. SCPT10]|uniref:hypothetical protein n=1 Tax=Ruegeria sp. SCP10 TaxID=3141377 RepID=UPI003338F960